MPKQKALDGTDVRRRRRQPGLEPLRHRAFPPVRALDPVGQRLPSRQQDVGPALVPERVREVGGQDIELQSDLVGAGGAELGLCGRFFLLLSSWLLMMMMNDSARVDVFRG